MRLVVWNCNNGINQQRQVDFFRSLNPDIAIIPELKQKNISALRPDQALWVTNNQTNKSPKGLGVLAYNGLRLEPLDRDEEMEIYIPVKVSKSEFHFNILAIWNFYTASKQGRFKEADRDALEYSALKHYRSFFTDKSIVAGDWNTGPTVGPRCYEMMNRMLSEAGLECLYRKYKKLKLEDPMPPTYRHNKVGTSHCIDHVYGSKFFQENVKSFLIGDIDSLVLSDHAPLIVEFSGC